MSEEDDFDMLLNDADSAMAAATLSDQATGGLLQRTGLGEMMENGGASTSDNNGDRGDKDGAAEARREWTAVERKVVEPCIELIKVSEVNKVTHESFSQCCQHLLARNPEIYGENLDKCIGLMGIDS